MADVLNQKNMTNVLSEGDDDEIIIKPPETHLGEVAAVSTLPGDAIILRRKNGKRMPSLKEGKFHTVWLATISSVAVGLTGLDITRLNPRSIVLRTDKNLELCIMELDRRVVTVDPPGSMTEVELSLSGPAVSNPVYYVAFDVGKVAVITVDGEIVFDRAKTPDKSFNGITVSFRPS